MMRRSLLLGKFPFVAILGIGSLSAALDLPGTAIHDPFAYCSHIGTIDRPAVPHQSRQLLRHIWQEPLGYLLMPDSVRRVTTGAA